MDLCSGGAQDPGHGLAHLRVVHDAAGGREQCRHTGHVGLTAAQLCAVETLQTQSIGSGTLQQRFHPDDLGVVGGHDQFAGVTVGDALLVTEFARASRAGRAQLGLQRAWLVVDPGVDDPAVVAGLVTGERRLLLHQDQARTRMPF